MEDIQIFKRWNEIVFREQVSNGLIDLYHVTGSSSSLVMSDVVGRKKPQHELPYSIFKLHDEFIVISKDMKYIGGVLYFLKPYIVNTEQSEGVYHQTLEDRRYLVYCTFGLQAVYHFWDRIGDLLHYYFPTNIKPGNVYFGRVKEGIAEEYKTSDNYKRLVELYNDTQNFFELRNEAVHHYQSETRYYWGNIQHSDDEKKRNSLNTEKFSYPDKIKQAMVICNEAFFTAVRLIDELPDDPEIIALRTGKTT